MAFGGSGFSFGANNNNQSTGFGAGFGTSTNTGFGAASNTNTTGFGASTTGNNPFGTTGGGFGNNNTSAFGSNNTGNSLFGNKTTSTPFGATTATTGGSLFGNNNNNNNPTGGFGANNFSGTTLNTGFGGGNNAGGSAFSFGANTNKPAFGAATSSTPLFGQGGAGTTTGFGNTTGFGGGAGTALNQPVPPSDGTASTPFAPTADKEANGTNNSYQSITFQQPYSKYSFEELRLADYNAGRRYGNGSGQAGAFGASSFGGFGNTNTTGGFGATNNTNNPFGGTTTTTTTAGGFGTNTATTGFGNNQGGGIFGNNQNKPAGSLFGTQNATTGTTGGIFGTANNTTGGFGTGNSGAFGGNTNTTGSLFGNNQNKPAGGLFGNNAQSGTTSLFGNNNQTAGSTGGNLFGNNATNTTGGGLFGNNQQSNTGGLFGNNNNQQQQKPGGLFGNAGGFGTSTTQNQTTGGLFNTANNATSNTGASLFGNNNTTNTGGLFGNNNASNTGGGLFGNANQNNNAGGGLFGNNAQNQNKPAGLFGTANAGGSLFGNNNNTSGGLFANAGTNNTGGLFSNANANKPTTSLFNTTNTNQPGGLFNSTGPGGGGFGLSQNNQQQGQQQQDGVKHSSLLDPNPYGQSSIWTGLPASSPENSKPVFTPLTASQKLKESMMKPPPSLRLNQSRYMTPPRRNGFGFTYSTYGTPNSAASTPGGGGLSGSMYGSRGWSGGSFGRSFNKSASVQNLRAQFSSDSDDLWKPGAFASTGRHSSGSIKRLTIDRSIRNDLFSRPAQQALPAPPADKTTTNGPSSSGSGSNGETLTDSSNKNKKRVSFDNSTTGGQLNGQTGALVRTESPEEDDGQSPPMANGDVASRGNELAVVPEDSESNHVSAPTSEVQARSDPKPGEYWMKPSRAEMAKMPRERLQKFKDFQVGRHGCGQVTFNGNVDLTAIPLDDLYDKIVEIRLRSVTVYPEASTKPPVGKGLNVPSTIAIENSWPRSRNQPSSVTSGPVFDKHVSRLKKMSGTEFVDYEVDTGIWTFRVPHYTRYGLDYDDENDDTDMSDLTPPPESISKSTTSEAAEELDNPFPSDDDDDDTFAFRQVKTVPGGFGRQSIVDDDFDLTSSALVPADEDMHEDGLSEQSAPLSEAEYSDDEPSMIGSYPAPAKLDVSSLNKPILKAPGTPGKLLLDLEGDWADQLQQTISPRKQNRDILRETQSKVLLDRAYSPIKPKAPQNLFRNSVDVMSSIFGQYEESRLSTSNRSGSAMKGRESDDFEFPYPKRAKTLDDSPDSLSDEDRKWLNALKAKFDGFGALIYKNSTGDNHQDGSWKDEELVEEGHEKVVRSELQANGMSFNLSSFLSSSIVEDQDGVPKVEHQNLPFSYLSEQIERTSQLTTDQQIKDLYVLAHILFDTYEDRYSLDLPSSSPDWAQLLALVRKDRLTEYLSNYILRQHGDKIVQVEKENPTAAALLKLSAHDIKGACDSLEKAKNHKLMLLVAQLENASKSWQEDVKAQIDAWRDQGVLSEISEDVRAIYEICAGNVTICLGKSAASVPVEDKAKTFALSEEFGFDWIQSFAMGLWYGYDEKKGINGSRIHIEDAVREFTGRCDRGEESVKPGNDVMWVLLQVYASLQGTRVTKMPVFPQALDSLASSWDVSNVFAMHFAITSTVEGVAIDDSKTDELSALLAWQLSSKGDVAGAVYALLHITDSITRFEVVKALLERFAMTLPDPPAEDTNAQTGPSLWTILVDRLQVPAAWIFTAKALYARSIDPSGQRELEYLIAAQEWTEAHSCFIHRVAPGCIVDADYDLLSTFVTQFGADVENKISDWYIGGGVYADFVHLVKSSFPASMDEDLLSGLARRLINMGREFHQQSPQDKLNLGKLPVEELEERVAVTEMSRVVAERLGTNTKEILDLPLTSDLRLKYTVALAGEHYRSVMASGAISV